LETSSAVTKLLHNAQRRSFVQLALDQALVALAIGMGGAIVLLLIGTQILEWYWVVALAVVSLGVGLYRLRKHIPSKYKLAQRIDRRLLLADALSTATHFASPEAEGDPAIRDRQREEAERIARTVDVRAALPASRPRYLYPATALAAAAIVLFGVRFAVTGKLDLEPSLVKIAFDTFFQPKQQLAQNAKQNRMKAPPVEQGDPDAPTAESDKTPDSPIDTQDPPDYSNPQAGDNSKDSAKTSEQQSPEQSETDQGDKGDKQQKGNDASQDDSKDSKSGDQKDGKQDSKQSSSNDSSSLMDKLKDAMANMLNKMKPSSAQEGQQSQQNAQKDQQNGQQQKSGQKGDQQQKQAENSNSDAQSDQSQDDQKQSADAKGAEKSSDKNASQDSKSGIGSADGDKSAKEAEQLKAMGKISEILGKRAQNVTGEVMVEVGSSKQQLKTPWAQKDATHSDAGSEIHRDEVPLMYQQYVEQYFEQIRKSGEAAKKKPEQQQQ
jgi:hypothetical protein